MRTMLRLTESQRALAGDKLADLANLAAGALVFGQAVVGATLTATTLALFAAGAIIWLVLSAVAVALCREGTQWPGQS